MPLTTFWRISWTENDGVAISWTSDATATGADGVRVDLPGSQLSNVGIDRRRFRKIIS